MTEYITNKQKPHLGGNLLDGDHWTWSPLVWQYIIKTYDIERMTDVGSGMGHVAKWFSEHGVTTLAIDGLEENSTQALYPTVLHDIVDGPFICPTDLVLCVELVEHVEERYLDNLLTTMCQGKFILMTHATPGQSGWHHVNCQPSEYWINHLENKGYTLSVKDTAIIQELATKDHAHHFVRSGMFFIKN